MNTSSGRVLEDYSNLLEKYASEQGIIKLVQLEAPTQIISKRISFPILANHKNIFSDIKISFDYIYWELGTGNYKALIPYLNVEVFANSLDKLEELLQSSLLIEFNRKKRFKEFERFLCIQSFKGFHTILLNKSIELPNLSKNESTTSKDAYYNKILLSPRHPDFELYHMEEELEELLSVFKENERKSIMLIGPSGSGKSALIYYFIKHKLESIKKGVCKETSASRFIRSLTDDSGWQTNLQKLSKELERDDVVLYLGHFPEYFEIGQYEGNEVSVGEALKESIQAQKFCVIAECTADEYAIFSHRYPAFASAFYNLWIPTKSDDIMKSIILSSIQELSKKLKIHIQEESITKLIRLQKRFFPYSGFPGKTIRSLEAILLGSIDLSSISEDIVLESFSQESGIPAFMLSSKENLDDGKVREYFANRLFGQREAIDTVVDTLLTVKADLSPSSKPIASLFFSGPTGVGKTEMAKAIADFMFGDEGRIIRLDMSEYNNPYSLLRLTGDVGSDKASLVSKIRQSTFAVVLFDEIEKAHPDFYDLLLQILGEGRLTNSRGELANFCSCIIIMTSNLGARESFKSPPGIARETGNSKEVGNRYETIISEYFRPELYNRIDRIVVFSSLGEKERELIVKREIQEMQKRSGFIEKNLQLEYDNALVQHFSNRAVDTRYGARQVKRVLQDELLLPLSYEINRFSGQGEYEVDLRVEDDSEIKVKVKKLNSIENQKLEKNSKSVLDKVTSKRRQLNEILNGKHYIEFFNNFKMDQAKAEKLKKIKRNKSKQADSFPWDDFRKREEFIKNYEKCESEVYDLERLCFDSRLNVEKPGEDLFALFNDWEKSLYSLCLDYYIYHNREKYLQIVIYAEASMAVSLFKYYISMHRAIKENYPNYKFNLNTYQIKEIQEENREIYICNKIYPEALQSYSKDSADFDAEKAFFVLEFEGEGAGLFWEGEAGKFSIQTKNKKSFAYIGIEKLENFYSTDCTNICTSIKKKYSE
ncbi:MAG: ATP-dependent Clp protease ATP-binding subunit, partial [Leptospiraceae bacterium]|nr:ATP-dependent Clp protease ATP-binding subunit [Leptospiraceae bacterium]